MRTFPTQIQVLKLALSLQASFTAHPSHFPTEGHLQAYCYQWWNIHFRHISYLYAVPNGGTRHAAEVIGMKAQGLRPGVTDLHLLLDEACTLFLEMKNGNRPLDPEQVLFKKKVEKLGFTHYKLDTFFQFAACMILVFGVDAASVL